MKISLLFGVYFNLAVVVALSTTSSLLRPATVVSDTSESQQIYSDELFLTIKGSDFNPVLGKNQLLFKNGILDGVNYTTVANSDTLITLQLKSGSYWKSVNGYHGGKLILLAVDSGDKFVKLGVKPFFLGANIATITERPTFFSSVPKIAMTQQSEFRINGTGFPMMFDNVIGIHLKFNSPFEPLPVGETIVLSHNQMIIRKPPFQAWSNQTGPLYIIAVSVRTVNYKKDWIVFPGKGIQVAEIIDDEFVNTTHPISINHGYGINVYRSIIANPINITGSGFEHGMSLGFNSGIKVDVDYKVFVESPTKAVLTLIPGRAWSVTPDRLSIDTVYVNNQRHELQNSGFRTSFISIAIIIPDPVVFSSNSTYYESQSRIISIHGNNGLDVTGSPVADIYPANLRHGSTYKGWGLRSSGMHFLLKEGKSWLPSNMTLKYGHSGKRVPLKLLSFDTGGGKITPPEPIVIGYIIKDPVPHVVCNDSCLYALNGFCDDGSLMPPVMRWYRNKMAPSGCELGTDCTDCGGVDAILRNTKALEVAEEEPQGFDYMWIVSIVFMVLLAIVVLGHKWYRHVRRVNYNRYVRLMTPENGEEDLNASL